MSVNKIKQEIRKCEKTIELETQMLDELRQQIVDSKANGRRNEHRCDAGI